MNHYIMEPEDIIRQQELQIRRLKEERDSAQEHVGRLLKALDEALDLLRKLRGAEDLEADRFAHEREDHASEGSAHFTGRDE